jgi:hypothetical protein
VFDYEKEKEKKSSREADDIWRTRPLGVPCSFYGPLTTFNALMPSPILFSKLQCVCEGFDSFFLTKLWLLFRRCVCVCVLVPSLSSTPGTSVGRASSHSQVRFCVISAF